MRFDKIYAFVKGGIMKRALGYLLTFVALTTGAFAQEERELWGRDKSVRSGAIRRAPARPTPSATIDDERELRRLVAAWDAALARRDTKTLERILSDDFTFTGMDGRMVERAKYLVGFRTSTAVYDLVTSSDVVVRLYGNTAIVAAYGEAKGKSGDEPFNVQYRYTDVWVKRRGQWQAVATQVTRVQSR